MTSGSPGINRNYLISNIFTTKSSFLGNYPHPITLKHIHNKLFNLDTIKLTRSIGRKNINYIQSGTVHLTDQNDRTSKVYNFDFKDSEEVEVKFEEKEYWTSLTIKPLFTKIKNLPFEIGHVSAVGKTVSQTNYTNSIKTSVLNSLGHHLQTFRFNI